MSASTDSAGVPWEGRHFDHGAAASDDDGSASPDLLAVLARFRAGECGPDAVVDVLRTTRLLVPLVARLGEAGVNEHGHDKSAELAIVTVAGPDGRSVLPAFSSVDAMRAWNPKARPVPADAVRVALAAASEDTELVVIDPTSVETEFAVRRPAVWAIGRSVGWVPSYSDADVVAAFAASVDDEPAVVSLALSAGDPDARLAGPEVRVELALVTGLDRALLDSLLARLQQRWAESAVIAERVDSLGVRLTKAS
jgi:hypothetical protein